MNNAIKKYLAMIGAKGGAACTGEPKREAQKKAQEVIRAKKIAKLMAFNAKQV